MLTDNQNTLSSSIFRSRVVSNHAYNLVVIIKIYTTDSGSGPAEGSCVGLIEAAAAPLASGKEDLT